MFPSGRTLKLELIRNLADQHDAEISNNGPSNVSSAVALLPELLVNDQPLDRLLFLADLVKSKSEGRRLCSSGGAYVGSKLESPSGQEDEIVFTVAEDSEMAYSGNSLIDGDLIILRAGKQRIRIIKVIDDESFRLRGLHIEPS